MPGPESYTVPLSLCTMRTPDAGERNVDALRAADEARGRGQAPVVRFAENHFMDIIPWTWGFHGAGAWPLRGHPPAAPAASAAGAEDRLAREKNQRERIE